MSVNPAKRFGFDVSIDNGNFTVFNLESKYKINPDEFLSKGRATPFEGCEVYGECLMTVCNGKTAWKKGEDNE